MNKARTLSCCLFVYLFIGLVVEQRSAEALIAAHLNYNGCNTCHKLHGSPDPSGSLLNAISPEVTCLACHGPLGIASEADIHDPLGHGSGNLGFITCLECHNAHTNGDDLSLPRTNSVGGYNIKLIGRELDFKVREETIAGLSDYKDVVFEVTPDDWMRPDGFGLCQICHVNIHNEGKDCAGCHAHDNGFAGAGCTGCHDGTGVEALAVGPESAHSETATGYTCAGCHSGHGDAGTIEIPNNTAVGIYYVANGETGISLGSSTVPGATEAEICWNCHVVEGVSEWGANTQAATGNSPYNYGSLNQPNWTTAFWSSANFSYKFGAIQSTHSVDGLATSPGLDPVDTIRCSYCHDVHELALAPGDTKAGKPYLRGTWKGNPYIEDGAPVISSTYTPRHWGAVPRGSTLNNEYGGYQIDQNNSYPTSGGATPTWNSTTSTWSWPAGLWTLNGSAGLCVLCHGANVDGMNTFGNAPDAWIGSNGHSNAAIGGSGSAAVNIFRTTWRAPSGVDTQGAKPDMGYRNHGTGVGYGFRGTDGRAFEFLYPTMDGQLAGTASRPYGGNYYQWGAQVNDTTIEKKYHQFSCSKCHNPHASRLPRLMITNCLDTKHNTWDDPRAGMNAVDQAKSNNVPITLSAASTPDNWGRTWSNTTSAQNCHRLAGDNRTTPVPGFGIGWNQVTPW